MVGRCRRPEPGFRGNLLIGCRKREKNSIKISRKKEKKNRASTAPSQSIAPPTMQIIGAGMNSVQGVRKCCRSCPRRLVATATSHSPLSRPLFVFPSVNAHVHTVYTVWRSSVAPRRYIHSCIRLLAERPSLFPSSYSPISHASGCRVNSV